MRSLADVRSLSGTPVAADFANERGTPIVIDRTAGSERVYILNDADEIIEVMSSIPFELRVAKGEVSGTTGINKFGRAPSGVQTTATDIWARADATPTQQIYVAPTAARVHAIASTDDNDGKTGSPSSTGARTVRVWGLTDWDTAEVSEDVTLDGTTGVNTANSYVFINRMLVLTSGTTGVNIGTITATAATDSTVSAVITAGDGQTQQAIFAWPSVQDFYLTAVRASINDNTAQTRVDLALQVNEQPDTSPLDAVFTRKDSVNVQNSGQSAPEIHYIPYRKFNGPGIIKLQGIANAADVDLSGGFDGYLVTNT